MTKKLKDKTEEFLMSNYVDICSGKMSVDELTNEIKRYFHQKNPKELITHSERLKSGEIYSKIYIRKSDFTRRNLNYLLGNLI